MHLLKEWDKHQYSGQEGTRPCRLQMHFPPSISDEVRLGYLKLKQSKQ